MANWKRLQNIEDVIDINILLMENYPTGNHVSYYVGEVKMNSDDHYFILTANGKIELYPNDYIYHFIRIDEIKF